MSIYRTGGHWGVTIVREGTETPDASGHRPDAQLVAVVVNGDQALAERICALLNADAAQCRGFPADPCPPGPAVERCPCQTEGTPEQAARR